MCTAIVSSRGIFLVDGSARGEDFYLATREDFFLAIRGDLEVATREDFFMATDNGAGPSSPRLRGAYETGGAATAGGGSLGGALLGQVRARILLIADRDFW